MRRIDEEGEKKYFLRLFMLYIVFVKEQVRKISKSKDKNAYNIIQI